MSGDRPETNTGNNQATATVEVGPFTPPKPCIAVSKVTPKQLFVGRKTTLTIHVTQGGKAVKGIHVRIKGPKIDVRTKASNSKGVIKHDAEDEEGRCPGLHPDRQQGLQHQAGGRDQRLHPAGDRLTYASEGVRETTSRAPSGVRSV